MMNSFLALREFLTSTAGRATSLSIIIMAVVAGAALLYFPITHSHEASEAATVHPRDAAGDLPGNGSQAVVMSEDKARTIGLEIVPVQRSDWPEHLRVTGRLELNQSRVAHVTPLVGGVVRETLVELGQTVGQGEILALIDSRGVGEAKLRLLKDELQLASANRTGQWHRAIHENTSALLEMLEQGRTLDEIQDTFQNRPVGAYWEQLVSALARLKQATADIERVRGLAQQSVIPEKELIRSRAEHEAAGATYRALKEQIRFDAQQLALEAQQKVQAAEAAVAISRSHLLILGYSRQEIESMDPIAEAERVAYYPVRSPIAGTVIAKDAPLSKHVDDQTELFRIADLSTVWLRADVFEKDLGAIEGLAGKSVSFKTNAYPGRQFVAQIFSLGDLVDDDSRASRLLAVVDNEHRLLKPGMFVQSDLNPRNDSDVLQLPASAVQRHAGTTFVFTSDSATGFERRDVELGRSTAEVVEIAAGLAEGELVVAKGGFALKSEMLSELMAEE